MKTLAEIRKDLKEIQYYYMRKEVFDNAYSTTGANKVLITVNNYHKIVQQAPPRLYDLYVSIYINAHTQSSFADKLGVTTEYIQMLHKRLLLYFQNNLIE